MCVVGSYSSVSFKRERYIILDFNLKDTIDALGYMYRGIGGLTLSLLTATLSPALNLCKQFGLRSGPTFAGSTV